MLRHLAAVTGAVAWSLDARGRRVALANLDAAFGDRFSKERKRQIGRASYQSFGRTMLELAWAPNLTRETIERLVDFEGIADSPCNTDPTKPAIYATMHYSNFEWVGLAGAFGICQMPLVAQQFKNPLLGPVFDRLRSSTGHPIIPRERAMLRMLKNLKEGGKFGFLADLSLDPKLGSTVISQFGGLQTSITQMHAALALKTGAAIVPLECRPITGGRYKIVWHPQIEFTPETPVQEITQKTWNVLEDVIRESPEYWLWSYKHWRFKPSNGDASRYPFYSNPAKRFDRLLKETHGHRG
jgi:lauroyl/myristoyl acyltransferase